VSFIYEKKWGTPVYHAKTRGNRYHLRVFRVGRNDFTLRQYTRSQETGCSTGYTLDEMRKVVANTVSDASLNDNINYQVEQNDLFDKDLEEEEPMKNIRKVELRWKDVTLVCEEDQAVYGESVTCSNEVGRLANILIGYEVAEVFLTFLLDNKNRVMGYHETSRGGLNMCALKPADALRSAIKSGAAAIIVAHNHPSGEPSPSPEDVQFTRRLLRAGKLLGIHFLDHVIIGERGEFFSFLDAGLMSDNNISFDDLESQEASA